MEGGATFVITASLAERQRTDRSVERDVYKRQAFSIEGMRRLKQPVDTTISLAFALGGFVAGAAGVVYAKQYTLTPYMGFMPGVKAFLACVVGGGSILGAVLGGLLLGAVSYTHLSAIVALLKIRPRTTIDADAEGFQRCVALVAQGKGFGSTCLLYTSRCV